MLCERKYVFIHLRDVLRRSPFAKDMATEGGIALGGGNIRWLNLLTADCYGRLSWLAVMVDIYDICYESVLVLLTL